MKYSRTKHYKYKLEVNFGVTTGITGYGFDNHFMMMCNNGFLKVKAGYTWDGSSIPHKGLIRVLSLWAYDPDRYCKKASLVHDALCQAMREGLIPTARKGKADHLYYEMCIEGGLPKWRAKKRFDALRKFGDSGIKPEKNPRNRIYDTEGEEL